MQPVKFVAVMNQCNLCKTTEPEESGKVPTRTLTWDGVDYELEICPKCLPKTQKMTLKELFKQARKMSVEAPPGAPKKDSTKVDKWARYKIGNEYLCPFKDGGAAEHLDADCCSKPFKSGQGMSMHFWQAHGIKLEDALRQAEPAEVS